MTQTPSAFNSGIGRIALLTFAIASAAHGAVLNVTTAVDAFDVGGTCSLREAVDSANKNQNLHGCVATGSYGNDTINVPAGDFVLTRVGSDNTDALGDLDLLDSVTLIGAGPGVTNIRGDTSAANSDRDRLVHVVTSGITVDMRNMTLRDGRTNNQAAGAGLRSEPGTTTALTNVVVGLNSADGNAGGILNQGDMTLDASAVTSNETRNALDGGAGIFNDGTMVIADSRILDNVVQTGDTSGGGGIYNQDALTITNSAIEGNKALANVSDRGGGAGIYNQGSLDMDQCTLSGNLSDDAGGGILTSCAPVSVRRTLFYGNEARLGGGLRATCPTAGALPVMLVLDSVIEANHAGSSGGAQLNGRARISRSTIFNNDADARASSSGRGGGLSLFDQAEVDDSSIIGNRAKTDGGGIFSLGSSAPVKLASVTVAQNVSNSDGLSGGSGGGLYVSPNTFLTLTNSVLAGNLENGLGNHDDCDGQVTTAAYTLVQQSSGCTLPGGNGIQENATAGLLAAADNGGALAGSSNARVAARRGLTRLPSATSPLLDAGDPAGCKAANGTTPLTLDQRSLLRTQDGPDGDTTARCDIGAVEVQPPSDVLFADGFE